ncbi:unnamed protein product [Lactuca virosa]|uniref:NB-ARC domain-containing protein n=1 Tax=Lactuca virosa TaxID=75947 RepID=A0AAU9NVL8_9ASTR|nr:unnamed protein product [Lactuca virosa]
MEFVSTIISPVIESLMVPVKKQLEYIFSSTKHVINMNTRMKQLDAASLDVKNHMEEQLKRVAEDKKMFDYVVKVVIGQQIDMFSIQQTVAEYMGESLTETSKTTRADRLRITFGNLSKGRSKVLVILDDVWETIELKDIGLSPFHNDFKLLLTSRNKNICNKIAVEANLDLTLVRVDVMEEVEALNFFWQITGVSKQHDVELNQIGSEIVRRCGFLPLAINFGHCETVRALKRHQTTCNRDCEEELKFLSLERLPKLIGLCNTANVIELPKLVELKLDGLPNFTTIYPENTSATSSMPSNMSSNQPFLNKEMLIPKLEILKILSMDKLKEIWPCQFSGNDQVNTCMLREIHVKGCDNLVNLFPTNPMSLLRHLEEISVFQCGSIEVLFDINMSCVGEIEERSSNLRYIWVCNSQKLRELWRMKGESSFDILIHNFQAVKSIVISGCESFVNIFTPTATSSDVRTLMNEYRW